MQIATNGLRAGYAMEGGLFFRILSRKHFLRRRGFWRCCMWSVLSIVIVAIASRNLIAHSAIENIGSVVLGNSVTVRQVQVGFTVVEISGLEVQESSLADAPQLNVRTIRLTPTLWRGLREGVWLQSIVVTEPTLHLRFDQHGNLLSRFPDSTPDGAKHAPQLPFELAALVDATLVIHQEGKSAFTISGARLTATVDRWIHVRAEIADLLGSKLQLESLVDQSTLGGRTTVSLHPMHLDTSQLAQLPFVPSHLAKHPLSGNLKVDLQIEHPPNDFDPLKQVVALHATFADVVSVEYGHITTGIELRASPSRWSRVVDGRRPAIERGSATANGPRSCRRHSADNSNVRIWLGLNWPRS